MSDLKLKKPRHFKVGAGHFVTELTWFVTTACKHEGHRIRTSSKAHTTKQTKGNYPSSMLCHIHCWLKSKAFLINSFIWKIKWTVVQDRQLFQSSVSCPARRPCSYNWSQLSVTATKKKRAALWA